MKIIIFGILLHVVVKIENIFQVLWLIQRLYVMKAISTNFVEKKSKLENGKFLYFTCVWLLTIGILIAVVIYCYLIKYQAIQNFWLREVLC